MPLDKSAPIRRATKEMASADANRLRPQDNQQRGRDDTPLDPQLVKFIHFLAAATVRRSMKKSGAP
jgi:hypothetical protein